MTTCVLQWVETGRSCAVIFQGRPMNAQSDLDLGCFEARCRVPWAVSELVL